MKLNFTYFKGYIQAYLTLNLLLLFIPSAYATVNLSCESLEKNFIYESDFRLQNKYHGDGLFHGFTIEQWLTTDLDSINTTFDRCIKDIAKNKQRAFSRKKKHFAREKAKIISELEKHKKAIILENKITQQLTLVNSLFNKHNFNINVSDNKHLTEQAYKDYTQSINKLQNIFDEMSKLHSRKKTMSIYKMRKSYDPQLIDTAKYHLDAYRNVILQLEDNIKEFQSDGYVLQSRAREVFEWKDTRRNTLEPGIDEKYEQLKHIYAELITTKNSIQKLSFAYSDSDLIAVIDSFKSYKALYTEGTHAYSLWRKEMDLIQANYNEELRQKQIIRDNTRKYVKQSSNLIRSLKDKGISDSFMFMDIALNKPFNKVFFKYDSAFGMFLCIEEELKNYDYQVYERENSIRINFGHDNLFLFDTVISLGFDLIDNAFVLNSYSDSRIKGALSNHRQWALASNYKQRCDKRNSIKL